MRQIVAEFGTRVRKNFRKLLGGMLKVHIIEMHTYTNCEDTISNWLMKGQTEYVSLYNTLILL